MDELKSPPKPPKKYPPKYAPALPPPDLSPEGRVRTILALSLCEEHVHDDDALTGWSSLDLIEAVVCCERDLNIPEMDEDRLLDCRTIGDIVKLAL